MFGSKAVDNVENVVLHNPAERKRQARQKSRKEKEKRK